MFHVVHDDISQYRILKSKVYKIKTIPFWMESKEGLTKCFMVVRKQCLLFALSAVYGDDVLSCTVAGCEDWGLGQPGLWLSDEQRRGYRCSVKELIRILLSSGILNYDFSILHFHCSSRQRYSLSPFSIVCLCLINHPTEASSSLSSYQLLSPLLLVKVSSPVESNLFISMEGR